MYLMVCDYKSPHYHLSCPYAWEEAGNDDVPVISTETGNWCIMHLPLEEKDKLSADQDRMFWEVVEKQFAEGYIDFTGVQFHGTERLLELLDRMFEKGDCPGLLTFDETVFGEQFMITRAVESRSLSFRNARFMQLARFKNIELHTSVDFSGAESSAMPILSSPGFSCIDGDALNLLTSGRVK